MLAQGFGGPCCARILTSWFATKERGTYWGMWNIAHNLGGFGAPILAGTAARYYGWKWGEPALRRNTCRAPSTSSESPPVCYLPFLHCALFVLLSAVCILVRFSSSGGRHWSC